MSDWNKERLFFIVIRINLIGLLARYGGAKSAPRYGPEYVSDCELRGFTRVCVRKHIAGGGRFDLNLVCEGVGRGGCWALSRCRRLLASMKINERAFHD